MMDIIYATRRSNLERLGRQRFKGMQKDLAKAVKRERSQVSRWLSKNVKQRQFISETIARELEKQLGLPRMWLDQEHKKPPQQDELTEFSDLISVPAPMAAPRKGARYVPVLGTLRMGIIMTAKNAVHFVEWATEDEKAFVVRVDSDAYAPRLRRGECLIIERLRTLSVGQHVLYKLKAGPELHASELLMEGRDSYRFGSINPTPQDKPRTFKRAAIEFCHPITAIVDAELSERLPGKWYL